jgi:hypothetical protein
MKESSLPAWAAEWLAKRSEKEVKKTSAEPAVQPDPEAEAKAAAAAEKRAESREAKVTAGLEELGAFLADLVRGGFAALPSKSSRFWEAPAARLIDAQAPGLARRMASLDGMAARGDSWPVDLLRDVSLLYLAREGWARRESLGAGTQADLRAAIGFTMSQEAALAQVGVRDRWCVVGQFIVGDGERLRTQRTWLLGAGTGLAALCLSFSASPNQPLDISLVPGTTIDAELVFFPSGFPLRALVKERFSSAEAATPILPHKTIAAATAFAAKAFAANPWIEQVPLGLEAVVPQRAACWIVRDDVGDFLKLDVSDQIGWTLLALSGGHLLSVAGEWNGDRFRPLGAWVEERFIRL